MLNFWQVCACIFGSLLVVVILYLTCLQAGLKRDAKEAEAKAAVRALSDSLLASGATVPVEPSPPSPALPAEP
jgi:hypothetical protein